MQGEIEEVKSQRGFATAKPFFECREPEAEWEKATCRRMRGGSLPLHRGGNVQTDARGKGQRYAAGAEDAWFCVSKIDAGSCIEK